MYWVWPPPRIPVADKIRSVEIPEPKNVIILVITVIWEEATPKVYIFFSLCLVHMVVAIFQWTDLLPEMYASITTPLRT